MSPRSGLALVGLLATLMVSPARAEGDPLERARELIRRARRPRAALDLIAQAVAAGRKVDPELLVLRAEAQLDMGLVKDAVADLDAVLRSQDHAPEAHELYALAEFFRGRDDAVRAHLEKARDGEIKKELPLLLEGPFEARWGEGARICRGPSKDGGYLIYSDLGVQEAHVEAARKKAREIREKAKDERDAETRLAKAIQPADGVKLCGRLMDAIARAYAEVFPFPKEKGLVHRVYVFAKRDDFLAFAKSLDSDMSDAAGWYDAGTRILAIDGDPKGDDLISASAMDTMLHEASTNTCASTCRAYPTGSTRGSRSTSAPRGS
jgi:tetratricopeptide (TPR) repeat protein